MASAVWTAIRAGRDRLSMYLALLLLLEASLVTLFTARDLVLFYAGWEVMMIAAVRADGRVGRRAAAASPRSSSSSTR